LERCFFVQKRNNDTKLREKIRVLRCQSE
jgi:hypothetical protein